jgi:hypothetical protein
MSRITKVRFSGSSPSRASRKGPVPSGTRPALLRHDLGLLRGGRPHRRLGAVLLFEGQPSRPEADDRRRGDDQGRNTAGSSRRPRKHARRSGLLGGDRRDEEPVRDQAHDPDRRPRDVQHLRHQADRGNGDGVHRRGKDALGVGRAGDHA